MGSPITFSGFNKIDFNMILDAVMVQERQPLDRLEKKKSTLETQNTQFSTLASKLGTLETAVDDLREIDSLAKLTASSSDTGVGVTATGGSVGGTYTVDVTTLARSQVLTSTTTYGSLTEVVGTAGTLRLTPTSAPAEFVDITLTGSTTLQGLADAINAETDSPASASVVQTAPGTYQLMLTAKDTGVAQKFTVEGWSTLTGGSGLTFADTGVANGISGDEDLDNTQIAEDAVFTVNSLGITSSSNTVTDVIPGVTLTLKAETTATITVNRDVDAAEAVVKKFVTAYNDLVTFAKDQNTAAIAGKASIGRDPVLQGFRSAIGNALRESYPIGGSMKALGMIGVGFDMAGKMVIDSEAFADAMEDAPVDVQKLLSGTDGTGGVFGALSSMIEEYTKAGGLVADAKVRIDAQVSSISQRLDSLETLLELRRDTLHREYIAADLAMTRLNAQSGQLSALGGQFRLF